MGFYIAPDLVFTQSLDQRPGVAGAGDIGGVACSEIAVQLGFGVIAGGFDGGGDDLHRGQKNLVFACELPDPRGIFSGIGVRKRNDGHNAPPNVL